MAENESIDSFDDMEILERWIEAEGGREALLERLDKVLFVKHIEEAISIARVDLIMSHPEIDWATQISLNTPEGRAQIDRLKSAMGESLQRAFDIVRRPLPPDA